MDIRSKGNRKPGFYLRTQVGMTGPVILGRASHTSLPYAPSQLSGSPMVPPLSSASLCSTEPLILLSSNVCPVSPCHRANVPPTSSFILHLPSHICISIYHLNFNASPLFHLISGYAHRLRPDPPHGLTLGFRRRTLRSHSRPSGRLAPADCSVRYGHARELHEARRAPASIRQVAFRAG